MEGEDHDCASGPFAFDAAAHAAATTLRRRLGGGLESDTFAACACDAERRMRIRGSHPRDHGGGLAWAHEPVPATELCRAAAYELGLMAEVSRMRQALGAPLLAVSVWPLMTRRTHFVRLGDRVRRMLCSAGESHETARALASATESLVAVLATTPGTFEYRRLLKPPCVARKLPGARAGTPWTDGRIAGLPCCFQAAETAIQVDLVLWAP